MIGENVSDYELIAVRAGTADLFVTRYVEAEGHCNISPAQTGVAFDALLAWARQGKKPAPGEQR